MKFGPISLEGALGCILGHNITDSTGRRVLRKGKPLSSEDLATLRGLGRTTVYAATLAETDVLEDTAAGTITSAVVEPQYLELSNPKTGRVNVHAQCRGVVKVDVLQLGHLNRCRGVTFATVKPNSVAEAGQMVATTKILPYALPEVVVKRACMANSALSLRPLTEKRVSLLVGGSPGAGEKILAGFKKAMETRLGDLGSQLVRSRFVNVAGDSAHLTFAEAIRSEVEEQFDLLILAGETAIQDEDDLTPRAIRSAGGEVTAFGAPVDPGNLILLGNSQGVPILGAPGCARSPRTNIVDMVLPRLLVGDEISEDDLSDLAAGGLLEDVRERPLPRAKAVEEDN